MKIWDIACCTTSIEVTQGQLGSYGSEKYCKSRCQSYPACIPHSLFKSYKLFCKTIIKSRIIYLVVILDMSKLLKFFKITVEKNEENTDNINVDNLQLRHYNLSERS